MNNYIYLCRKCSHEIKDDNTLCPNCNADLSKAESKIPKVLHLSINERIVFHEKRGIKVRHRKGQKPFIEQSSGSVLFHETGEFNDRTMIVDREGDLYKEIIKDPKTGEIIHQCIEPLSKHTRHGDAKNKKI
jgi:DNA-directed RNA polymerase subunit RPC12/RpoP